MLNSAASIFVGIYILNAIARGNGGELLRQLSADATSRDGLPGLIQWLVAILILQFLASNPTTSKVGKPLLFAAYGGLAIQFVSRNGIEVARERVTDLWDYLGFNGG